MEQILEWLNKNSLPSVNKNYLLRHIESQQFVRVSSILYIITAAFYIIWYNFITAARYIIRKAFCLTWYYFIREICYIIRMAFYIIWYDFMFDWWRFTMLYWWERSLLAITHCFTYLLNSTTNGTRSSVFKPLVKCCLVKPLVTSLWRKTLESPKIWDTLTIRTCF